MGLDFLLLLSIATLSATAAARTPGNRRLAGWVRALQGIETRAAPGAP